MALTDAQILDCLLILGLPVRTDVTFALEGETSNLRRTEVALEALRLVNAAQEAKILILLTQWGPVEFDTDTLQTEGLDSSPSRTRGRISRMLSNTLGLNGDTTGITVVRG